MDPSDPKSFTWKEHIVRSGHKYRYIDQNESSQDAVLCLHGFPDLAFGWRHQIIELVRRGYRVIAPDLLGYGGTSKPTEVEAYTFRSICQSINEILDHLHVAKVVLVGHDWGAPLSGRFLFYFPRRVRLWVTICAPPRGGPKADAASVDWPALVREKIPNFGYQLYFMGEEAGQELTLYAKTFLLVVYCHMARRLVSAEARQVAEVAANSKPSYVLENVLRERLLESKEVLELAEIDDPETEYYVSEFKRGGMIGPVNWYKTRALNHRDDLAAKIPETFPVDIPSLFIRATDDEALPPSLTSETQLASLFPGRNLDVVTIDGANHWLLQDPSYRDTFTSILCNWIDERTKTVMHHL